MRDPDLSSSVIADHERRLEIQERRDLRNVAITEGGIAVGSAFVGELPDGTLGLGFVYDGELMSAATVADMHKANLATQSAELVAQLASINYLNEQKNLHAATLAAHGTELSSQAGSINYLAGIATGHSGQISALQSQVSGLQSEVGGLGNALGALESTVGGMSGLADLITALDDTNRIQNLKIVALENRLDRLDGGGGGPVDPGA